MRVPVQISVGGKLVKITYPDTVPGHSESDPDCWGDTTSDGLEIRISRSRHKTEREVFSTIFHEVLHSTLTISGICHMLGDKLEESVVTGTENAIAPLFCFNPDAKIKWKDIDFPQEDE